MNSALYKRGVARATVVALALCASGIAIADDGEDPATKQAKEALNLQKLELEVAKQKAEYYKGLVPDLGDYKVAKPEVPAVSATTTRLAYNQASLVASRVAGAIHQAYGQAKVPDAKVQSLLLDSPSLLASLSDAKSVESLLQMTEQSVRKATDDLNGVLNAVTKPQKPPGERNPDRALSNLASGAIGAAVLPAVIKAVFAIPTALQTQYAFNSVQHLDLSGQVLRAKVIAELMARGVEVIDPDAYLPLGASSVQNQLDKTWKAIEAAKDAAAAATKVAQGKKSANPKDEGAALLDAQVKELSTVIAAGDKYYASILTPSANGVTPLVSAQRGQWLQGLAADAPRLQLTALAATADIVAANGTFKGLRISVAGNTVVGWRLVTANGRVYTGADQSCSEQSSGACLRTVLTPDDTTH